MKRFLLSKDFNFTVHYRIWIFLMKTFNQVEGNRWSHVINIFYSTGRAAIFNTIPYCYRGHQCQGTNRPTNYNLNRLSLLQLHIQQNRDPKSNVT